MSSGTVALSAFSINLPGFVPAVGPEATAAMPLSPTQTPVLPTPASSHAMPEPHAALPAARDVTQVTPTTDTAVPDHAGEDYHEVLRRIHHVLKPKTYLEVGTSTGNSLALAECPSIAIDPSFAVTANVIGKKTQCHFFQMGSDEFFRAHSPQTFLGNTIDLAFLDGMHLFEYLLRDFTNIERHCTRNSIIALHDCIPTDAYITERTNDPAARELVSTRPGWWTGDVWKVVLILQKYRPDLTIVCVDAPPTGLVLITNLYPDSRILRDRYQELCTEFGPLSLPDYGLHRFLADLNIVSTRQFTNRQSFGPHFWL
jgi:predicted O-methyltransferase YrrM